MNVHTYADLQTGMNASFIKKISQEDISKFSEITGDKNPLHLDKDYAQSTQFKKPVVFGMLIESLLSTLVGMYLPGKYSLILSVESSFKKPGFVGDTLKVMGEIEQKIESQKVIIIKTKIENQNSEILQTGKMFVQILK